VKKYLPRALVRAILLPPLPTAVTQMLASGSIAGPTTSPLTMPDLPMLRAAAAADTGLGPLTRAVTAWLGGALRLGVGVACAGKVAIRRPALVKAVPTASERMLRRWLVTAGA